MTTYLTIEGENGLFAYLRIHWSNKLATKNPTPKIIVALTKNGIYTKTALPILFKTSNFSTFNASIVKNNIINDFTIFVITLAKLTEGFFVSFIHKNLYMLFFLVIQCT